MAARHERRLLVSDVDDTLLGEDESLARLHAVHETSLAFLLALNSSRPLASVRRTLRSLEVPLRPQAIIGALGTEVEIHGRPDPSFAARFHPWRRDPVDRLMQRLGFAPHDAEYQTPHKASFTVPASEWRAVRHALRVEHVVALVVTSGESSVDVLPPQAGKGPAMLYVAEQLGVDRAQILIAGDSSNDLSLFEVAPRGILVGNARSELREAVRGLDAYQARASHSAGILEGLAHFGWIDPSAPELRKTE